MAEMYMVNWRRLPEIKSIGPIPAMGDCYYDGVLDAHNEKYFITVCDTYHAMPFSSNDYEYVYLVYKMNKVFNALLNKDVMKAREFAEKSTPVGYIWERNLERV